MKGISRNLIWVLALLGFIPVKAQQTFSVSEAINYAVKNHASIKNAQLDINNASARVNEIKAIGLPQLNGNISYTNNVLIPRFFVPANAFNPNAKEGEVTALKFGIPQSGNAGINLSQLVFDGSYLLGLKAADVYKELSAKSMTQTKQQIAEAVYKAYYGALVDEERLKLLEINIGRLDSLLRETRALQAKGFVEKIDVQRLEVQSNNLKTETENVKRLQTLSFDLLKFQMGIKLDEPLSLSTKMSDIDVASVYQFDDSAINYALRPEYSILQTQQHLQELDLKNQKVAAYPRVLLTGNLAWNNGQQTFGNLLTNPWFAGSSLGLNIQVPIFDGFARKYKTIQSANTLQKVKNSYTILENSIDLQVKQAKITLNNGYASLQENKKNMELAQEIERVTRTKYKQGLGTNLEVLNAQSSLKEAQTNYFTALYNVLIARVDLDKATGKIYSE